MVTFSKVNNVVKVDLQSEVHFMPADSRVFAVNGKILIGNGSGEVIRYASMTAFYPTEVNGRPSDVLIEVAQWLIDEYFSGIAGGGGGGGGGDASAANQAITNARLQTIIDQSTELNDKTASGLITETHDNKAIAYLGNGDIDYVAFKTGVTEVARLTFGYSSGNLISITKS